MLSSPTKFIGVSTFILLGLSFNHSNDLAAPSSLGLPWFFEENYQSSSMVVNSSSSLFSRGKQSALMTRTCSLDLCGGVPWEVVHDVITMAVNSCNSASVASMWENSQELPVHHWPLVPLGNHKRANDLVEVRTLGCWFLLSS